MTLETPIQGRCGLGFLLCLENVNGYDTYITRKNRYTDVLMYNASKCLESERHLGNDR